MIKTLSGFVHARPDDFPIPNDDWAVSGFELSVWRTNNMEIYGLSLVAPATITFDLPDNWDPRPAMVDVLRKEQEKIRKQCLEQVQTLEDKRAKYLAIGN